jgi:hypothetical protein
MVFPVAGRVEEIKKPEGEFLPHIKPPHYMFMPLEEINVEMKVIFFLKRFFYAYLKFPMKIWQRFCS